MKYCRLGHSDLTVSELCLGTMLFGEQSQRGTPPEIAEQMLEDFSEVGGNFIDTANVYGNGVSEEIIGNYLKGRRGRYVIATNHGVGLQPSYLANELEGSLRRLQTDYVDLFYIHLWDYTVPIDETLSMLNTFITSGKVRYLGVSNLAAWQVMKCLSICDRQGWPRFVSAQYQYSLVVRDIEREFTELFMTEGLGEVVWGPLGGGFLSGKYHPGAKPATGRLAISAEDHEEAWDRRSTAKNWKILEVIDRIVQHRQVSHAQVALNWLLAQPAVTSILVGARTLEQLRDNMQCLNWTLSTSEIGQLDQVSGIEPGFPYRLLQAYSPRR